MRTPHGHSYNNSTGTFTWGYFQEYSNCCGDLTATAGSCDTGCTMLIPYIFVLFLVMFFTFLNNVIFLTVNLRYVL